MSDMQYKRIGWDLVKADGPTGIVEGYGAVFGNVDNGGDVILPGAFAETIKEHREAGTMPAFFGYHDRASPVGEWLEMREDAKGLWMRGRLWVDGSGGYFATESAREAFNMLRSGGGRGFSIGYRIPQGGSKTENGVHYLERLKLVEVSAVPLPMNELALPTMVKGDGMPTKRQLERILRDVGFSRNQAQGLLAKGYDHLLRESADDADRREDDTGLEEAARKLLASIQSTTAAVRSSITTI